MVISCVEPFRIFITAGEPSGDVIGARLIKAMHHASPKPISFSGIGGHEMQEQGFVSLFAMSELTLMGLIEVLPHARHVLRRIQETVNHIMHCQPDIVVTIDSSGFSFRLAQALRRRGYHGLLVHYVAPMVWAWRSKRVALLARLYDHLLTLLPFEPSWFETEGLTVHFVGHPSIEELLEISARNALRETTRQAMGLGSEDSLLCLLPGSRRSEVNRLLPIFHATVQQLIATYRPIKIIVPTVPELIEWLEPMLADWSPKPILVKGKSDRRRAFAAADVALAASGTVALETGLMGLPTVVGYRVHPLTAFIVRRFLTVDHVSIINLLLNQPLIPEHLQEKCTPARLSADLRELLTNPVLAAQQKAGFAQATDLLTPDDGILPSIRAAEILLDLILAKRGDERTHEARPEVIPTD